MFIFLLLNMPSLSIYLSCSLSLYLSLSLALSLSLSYLYKLLSVVIKHDVLVRKAVSLGIVSADDVKKRGEEREGVLVLV